MPAHPAIGPPVIGMPDETKERARKYLASHPLALELCYLAEQNRSTTGITAGKTAQQLGISIQATTNSFRDLLKQKLLESEKVGRTRFYKLKPQYEVDLDFLISDLAEESLKGRRTRESAIPMKVLYGNLLQEFNALGKELVEQGQTLKTSVVDVDVDFVFRHKGGLPSALLLLHVVGGSHNASHSSFMAALGTLFCLSEKKKDFNLIVVVFLIDTNADVEARFWALPSLIKSAYGEGIILLESHVNDAGLISRDFAKKIAEGVWSRLSGGRKND